MRKLLFILAIVFALVACDNNGMNEQIETNPFIGTWETNDGLPINSPRKLVFTDNETTGYNENGDIFTRDSGIPDVSVTWKGTYEYTDTELIIDISSSSTPILSIRAAYEFKNDNLYVSGCPYIKK